MDSSSVKLLSMLGICRKAGRLAVGSDAVMKAIRIEGGGKAKLVLISSDASSRTTKQFTDKCAFYGVTAVTLPADSFDMGHAVGKNAVTVCAVTDASLASALEALIGGEQIIR